MKKGETLLVDDDESYLRLVASLFEQRGIKAHYALSGEEAVGLLKSGAFTTLITDLNLPGMDGFELAMIARELIPGIRVVMVTGDISPDIPRCAEDAGISMVLAKPFDFEQLQKLVRGRSRTAATS